MLDSTITKLILRDSGARPRPGHGRQHDFLTNISTILHMLAMLFQKRIPIVSPLPNIAGSVLRQLLQVISVAV